MKIDIQHLARLSKLRIDPAEEAAFAVQMEGIVDMVNQLPELSATEQTVDPENVMTCRADQVSQQFTRDVLLKNAPQTQAGCVVVPKVME